MEPVGEETIRPSARKADTKTPSTVTSSSMIRDSAAFVITTSFRTSPMESSICELCTTARSIRRSS